MSSFQRPSGDDPASGPEQVGRRRFLRWASAAGAALSALLVGVPSVVAFFAPAFRRPPKRAWIKVAEDIATLDVGIPTKVDFVEATQDAWVESRALRTVWLYSEDGETFTAYSGTCTHLGCSYGYDQKRDRFVCPCHRGVFDVKTGAVLSGPPPRALDTLPVKVENDSLYVEFETFRTGIKEKVVA
jgi:menaquinol-cytochrome c reductase iron-sulfur subunit